MKRSTRWMVFAVYYLSQVLGLVGFSYNSKTDKFETSRFITLYSGIVSALMLFTLSVLFHLSHWQARPLDGHELHIKINAVMFLIHIVVVLITVIMNWARRQQFMATARDFMHMRKNLLKKLKMSVKVEQFYEKAIRKKFICGLISDTVIFFLSRNVLNGMFDINIPLIIVVLAVMIIILNIIMTHHFFALLNISVLLAVVNEEVHRVLNSSVILVQLKNLKKIKPGALVKACCKLSDELDELAVQHYNLQNMGERINRLYDVHAVCVLLTLYLNNISVIYMTYMVLQHDHLTTEDEFVVIMVVFPISSLLFYMDLSLYFLNMLKYSEIIGKTASLLKTRQNLMPSLDERFEKSLKNFSLQLAAFPFQMKLLGLFQFNRSMAFATFGSAISNAIVLMQYDYKYSEN